MFGAGSQTQNQRITKFPVSVPTGTGTQDGWDQPLPFKSINLPHFPVGELPTTVSGYVRAVAETTQMPTDCRLSPH